MGRGSDSQKNLAQQQLDMQNKWITSQQQTQAEGRALILPKAQELMKSTGYDDATKSAMTGNAMEATDAAYGAADQQMGNRVARTRNNAGFFFANSADLATKRAQQKSDTARALPQLFADEQQRRQMSGLQALASTYGIDTNLLASIAGLPNASLNNRAQGLGSGTFSAGPLGQWG
jgi:hypothetical protein